MTYLNTSTVDENCYKNVLDEKGEQHLSFKPNVNVVCLSNYKRTLIYCLWLSINQILLYHLRSWVMAGGASNVESCQESVEQYSRPVYTSVSCSTVHLFRECKVLQPRNCLLICCINNPLTWKDRRRLPQLKNNFSPVCKHRLERLLLHKFNHFVFAWIRRMGI